MRKECPICGSEKRRDEWEMRFLVPDGWTLPALNIICECVACGFVWYDNDKSQADYDTYYVERYGYGTDFPDDRARLETLAADIGQFYDPLRRIVDFGGGEGYLVKLLEDRGYRAKGWNVGDPTPGEADLIVASHVLEHIHDLDAVMRRFQSASLAVMVEIPDSLAYARRSWPPILDFHQKHINHFAPAHLDMLFLRYGYHRTWERRMEFERYNAPVYRALYRQRSIYYPSKQRVERSLGEIAGKLKAITGPVVVWGCGDIALSALAQVDLEIAHYVDNDPAFQGATIGGIPVLDHVESGAPILVLAQGQRAALLERIRAEGLPNEIVEI